MYIRVYIVKVQNIVKVQRLCMRVALYRKRVKNNYWVELDLKGYELQLNAGMLIYSRPLTS